MITIESTPNLTGVKITGDFHDFYELVEAFYDITINEFAEKHSEYIDISTRLLGLSYEIRHAYQGDRDIEIIENGMTRDIMKFHERIVPDKNLYYSCNYLYPEMFYCMIAINNLIMLRIKDITKTKYVFSETMDRRVIWDRTISVLRSFQSAFAECVKNILTERSYTMWLKELTDRNINVSHMCMQYIDIINIDYIKMNKEKRLKNFSKTTKRISHYLSNQEHAQISDAIYEYANEYNCSQNEIVLNGMDYPEEIEW